MLAHTGQDSSFTSSANAAARGRSGGDRGDHGALVVTVVTVTNMMMIGVAGMMTTAAVIAMSVAVLLILMIGSVATAMSQNGAVTTGRASMMIVHALMTDAMKARGAVVAMAVLLRLMSTPHAKSARYTVTQPLIVGGATKMILMMIVAMTRRLQTWHLMALIQTGTLIVVLLITSQEHYTS